MNFFSVLYTLFIEPLELIFEVIFYGANSVIHLPAICIIVLSLAMNFMVLPLYKRADALQAEEKAAEEMIRPGEKHIKKTFKGDERFMVLKTFYRQNNYKPYYALKGTTSLLLEIPFFIAAYNFLSNTDMLFGVYLGPIRDLSEPDGLIKIGSLSINVLPILMTAINIVSCIIYSEHLSRKSKIQLYAMAGFFMIFLYQSPSGLVFYWTLNNIFSLVKNLIFKYKSKKPKKVKKEKKPLGIEVKYWQFLMSGIFCTLFLGLLIPSAVISSSTAEFININTLASPSYYIVHALLISVGFFIVWTSVIYYFANKKARVFLTAGFYVLSVWIVLDYMLSGLDMGTLSAQLQYDAEPVYVAADYIKNTLIILGGGALCAVIFRFKKEIMSTLLIAGVVAVSVMGIRNMTIVNREYNDVVELASKDDDTPQLTLSENGKNVIVIFMDRMVGYYIPYIFEEKPELKEVYDGFTFYPQTVSFGRNTNYGAPPLYGGYEYIPTEMNKRDDVLLADKHDESLKVMQVIFDEAGYDVTVCDPPYAGYKQIPDLSIYDDYPDINTYITIGKFNNNEETVDYVLKRNLFCYSVFKSAPVLLQQLLYDKGNYCSTPGNNDPYSSKVQSHNGMSKSVGYDYEFLKNLNVLSNLPAMSDISGDSENAFVILGNELTHHPVLLKEPEYVPEYNVNNSAIDETLRIKYLPDGSSKDFYDNTNYPHYHANMATIIELGKWFEYLKEKNIYDNCRIIIVSDHAWHLGELAEMEQEFEYDDPESGKKETMTFDLSAFNCTLLVKDFNAKGFSIDDTFMTNADVPTIAFNDLIDNPVNPFTGNVIDSSYKETGVIDVTYSENWQISKNKGYKFLPERHFIVSGDIFDMNSWKYNGLY